MRRACIDIGSNTTRLLVADCGPQGLAAVDQERQFTLLTRAMGRDGAIAPAKIDEVANVVAKMLRRAGTLDAPEVYGVATAALRRAGNRAQLVTAIRERCGLEVEILSEEKEGRLAFIGASRTLGYVPQGELGVVDVGGGSSQLVVGGPPDRVIWSASLAVGSGDLASCCLRSDPPSAAQLSEARERVASVVADVDAPHPREAVAVGGAATSLGRLAGPLLDGRSLTRSLALLGAQRAREVAARFAIDVERVRLLPGGLLILQAAAELFGTTLQVGHGGLREGVLLEASRRRGSG